MSLVQCESNLIGIVNKEGVNVGSGGWANIVEKYTKAKAYCERPFEILYQGGRKLQIFTTGEWIGDHRGDMVPSEKRQINLFCQSSTQAELPPASLDGVFTDPPYFGNVQYAELMDFCYVWLRRLVGSDQSVFASASTRNENELTGNATMERGLEHFTEGLSSVFQRMARALRPGAPLVFTYHHNNIEAYYPVAIAILDAGLTCSASLPCPAEMGASIHINGTGSSIVDTVFVCRSTGSVPRRWIAETPEAIAALVENDLSQLRAGGLKPTQGDVRCIIYGHLTRLAIWRLRKTWDKRWSTFAKLEAVANDLNTFGSLDAIEKHLAEPLSRTVLIQGSLFQEKKTLYEVDTDEIPF